MVQMETPPLLRGTEQEQLAQLRSYLFQAAQHLNLALNDLSMDSFGKDVQEAIQEGGTQSAEKVQTSVDQTASALKDLIIKTANVIYQQMDVLETVLRSEYVAVSDFGQYQEEIESRLTQTAENTTAAYDYAAKISADTDARLTELAGDQDALREMLVKSSGYIKQGIIGYNGAVPIIGIAIGQDVKTTGKVEVDGQTYEVVDTTSNMTTWTPERMSFFINGTEAAWFSNGALHVGRIEVSERIVGGNWDISFTSGLTVKWIGG